MCLVFVAWRARPRYRLVVAANRDEYHARPTAPAAPWEDGPDRAGHPRAAPALVESRTRGAIDRHIGDGAGGRRILAGRDLLAGGTWLGVTPDGRFAALTNVSGSVPPGPGAPSRGRLAVDFLRGTLGAREYAREVSAQADRYSGFNLLLADREDLHCVTNRGGERMTELADGCHGLGNDRLNAPEPKVTGGLVAFGRVLDTGFEADDLFALLADGDPEDATGAGGRPGAEGDRTARFIRNPVYGTRSSTVVCVGGTGRVVFAERSFDARAVESGRVAFENRDAGDGWFPRAADAFFSRTAAAD